MDNFTELIKKRRSMRKFTEQTLSQEEVVEIMKAALMSPSSKRSNCWQFIVVDDKDKLEKLSLCKENGSSFVKDAPMNISDLDIYYEDGSQEAVALKNEFKAGGESRVIDIKSTVSIKKIVFTYKSIANSKDEKATVELYGMK